MLRLMLAAEAMSNYLYYRQGDEWVRVEADDYAQETSSTPGQCSGNYRLAVNVTWTGFGQTQTRRLEAGGGYRGPLTNFRVQTSPNGQKLEWYVDTVSNGTVLIGSVFYDRGTPYSGDFDPFYFGGDDNCGAESCITTFTLGGSVVLTLDDCPEVTGGPHDCSDCCRQHLPVMRSLSLLG